MSSNAVDFVQLLSHPEFKQFQNLSGALQRVDLFRLNECELISFFINVYNVMIIHAYLVASVPDDAVGAQLVRRFACYDIGGLPYTPDAVLNGVLRANVDQFFEDG